MAQANTSKVIETSGTQPNVVVSTGKDAVIEPTDVVLVIKNPSTIQALKDGNKMKHIVTTGGYQDTAIQIKDGKVAKTVRVSLMASVYANVKK